MPEGELPKFATPRTEPTEVPLPQSLGAVATAEKKQLYNILKKAMRELKENRMLSQDTLGSLNGFLEKMKAYSSGNIPLREDLGNEIATLRRTAELLQDRRIQRTLHSLLNADAQKREGFLSQMQREGKLNEEQVDGIKWLLSLSETNDVGDSKFLEYLGKAGKVAGYFALAPLALVGCGTISEAWELMNNIPTREEVYGRVNRDLEENVGIPLNLEISMVAYYIYSRGGILGNAEGRDFLEWDKPRQEILFRAFFLALHKINYREELLGTRAWEIAVREALEGVRVGETSEESWLYPEEIENIAAFLTKGVDFNEVRGFLNAREVVVDNFMKLLENPVNLLPYLGWNESEHFYPNAWLSYLLLPSLLNSLNINKMIEAIGEAAKGAEADRNVTSVMHYLQEIGRLEYGLVGHPIRLPGSQLACVGGCSAPYLLYEPIEANDLLVIYAFILGMKTSLLKGGGDTPITREEVEFRPLVNLENKGGRIIVTISDYSKKIIEDAIQKLSKDAQSGNIKLDIGEDESLHHFVDRVLRREISKNLAESLIDNIRMVVNHYRNVVDTRRPLIVDGTLPQELFTDLTRYLRYSIIERDPSIERGPGPIYFTTFLLKFLYDEGRLPEEVMRALGFSENATYHDIKRLIKLMSEYYRSPQNNISNALAGLVLSRDVGGELGLLSDLYSDMSESEIPLNIKRKLLSSLEYAITEIFREAYESSNLEEQGITFEGFIAYIGMVAVPRMESQAVLSTEEILKELDERDIENMKFFSDAFATLGERGIDVDMESSKLQILLEQYLLLPEEYRNPETATYLLTSFLIKSLSPKGDEERSSKELEKLIKIRDSIMIAGITKKVLEAIIENRNLGEILRETAWASDAVATEGSFLYELSNKDYLNYWEKQLIIRLLLEEEPEKKEAVLKSFLYLNQSFETGNLLEEAAKGGASLEKLRIIAGMIYNKEVLKYFLLGALPEGMNFEEFFQETLRAYLGEGYSQEPAVNRMVQLLENLETSRREELRLYRVPYGMFVDLMVQMALEVSPTNDPAYRRLMEIAPWTKEAVLKDYITGRKDMLIVYIGMIMKNKLYLPYIEYALNPNKTDWTLPFISGGVEEVPVGEAGGYNIFVRGEEEVRVTFRNPERMVSSLQNMPTYSEEEVELLINQYLEREFSTAYSEYIPRDTGKFITITSYLKDLILMEAMLDADSKGYISLSQRSKEFLARNINELKEWIKQELGK